MSRNLNLWTGQRLHFLALAVLLGLAWVAWRWLGQPAPVLFWLAMAVPIAHQLFVWTVWRRRLLNSPSGSIDFGLYLVLFFLLFGGRFVSIAALGWADRGSLGLSREVAIASMFLLSAPGLYAGYSVARYFGMKRAAGGDHFDVRYREMPLVKEGIFRYTNNGMYWFAFLLFWAIAVGFDSAAALVVAAFSHAYIWVHFHATEKPDMRYLYTA